MIEKIITFSIKKRFAVVILTIIFSLIGGYNAWKLPIDAVPDVTNVQVSVVTGSGGLSPIEIEQFITYPVETAMTGLPNVKEIRSISRTGVSSVTIVFEDHVNIWFARQLVNERLKEVEIPAGYGSPELSPVATALGDIYEFALTSEKDKYGKPFFSPMQLRTYLDWELAKKIKSLPGVIDINTMGGKDRQYQILIDPKRLAVYKITLSHLLESLKKANINVGGGYITKGNEQLVIRGEGQFKGIEEIRNTAIRTDKNGIPLLLGNLAKVQIGSALRFGTVTMNGKGEVVGCTVMMLIGQNSREVVKIVKEKIKELEKTLPPGMKIESYYDRSDFINRALKTVFINLSEGAILVFITLIITLGTVKGGALVALAIPVSMLVTVIFMRQLGVVGNLMSLGALDFGLLVDGSIVMLESVLGGFYLNQELYKTRPSHEYSKITQKIILKSCIRVGRAAAFSVAIIMLVYLPLMVLEGQEGKMFRPMAITVAIALGSALIFSITTFPATVSYLFARPVFHHSKYWDWLQEKFAATLEWTLTNRSYVVISSLGLIAFSILLGLGMGAEFIPRIDEGEFTIDIKRLPSTSLEYSTSLNQKIEKVILKNFSEAISAVSRTGRGESAAEPVGTDEAEVMVKLKPKEDWIKTQKREELMSMMKEKILAEVPSTYLVMSQPIEDRVNTLISGSKADVVLKIYGDNLNTLKKIGEDVAGILEKINGSGDVRVQRILGLPLLDIKVNRNKMARYGVSANEILDVVETLRIGVNAGKVFEGLKRFDLIVRMDVDVTNMELVENLPVMTSHGSTVPLGLIADIQLKEGPASITRESLKRRIFVEVNIRGRDLVSYISEAKQLTQEYLSNLPSGYSIKWGGQFENFTRAKNRLMVVVPIALIIIFSMLIAAFGNINYALGVFLVIPLAISGGIISLIFRGLPFSIPAGVGFIAVSGISVLNGVVYASILKDLISEGFELQDAVVESAYRSLRPILTTQIIAGIGFLPMAVSTNAGAEIQRPLATVVIGGIIVVTLFSNLLLPIIMQFLLSRGFTFEQKNSSII